MRDSIFLTYPYQPMGKIKKRTAERRPQAGCMLICDVIVMLKYVTMSRLSVFRVSGSLFSCFSNIEVLSGEQEKESIIRVRMG